MDVWEEVNKELLPQYGTSMHWPYCRMASCTGCLPERDLPEVPRLDLSIFLKDV